MPKSHPLINKNNHIYDRTIHAAASTDDYIFNQLIPYIGNKRKLLSLITQALNHLELIHGSVFLDLFSGSGVVSRLAKTLNYQVISNDWEPYSKVINECYISFNKPPAYKGLGGYQAVISYLNQLAPKVDWVTNHLCPKDDEHFDIKTERLFYMRKNGMKIDAIRCQILEWKADGIINDEEETCLLAPLIYQACYRSNTSGVFKGFHNGWGGQTKTALYRIAADLELTPAVFYDNGLENKVFCSDAQNLAESLADTKIDAAYLDPPYNQHPYGSNYHVLNSVALWDKPKLSKSITKGTKSAIRLDWRTERRSAYNSKSDSEIAYQKLINSINSRYIITSYSTDGFINLENMLKINQECGEVRIEMQEYKRYRVSAQRFSNKPMNVEFVIILDKKSNKKTSIDELLNQITSKEQRALDSHPENQV